MSFMSVTEKKTWILWPTDTLYLMTLFQMTKGLLSQNLDINWIGNLWDDRKIGVTGILNPISQVWHF